jgi:hypothetical protein
MKIPSEEQILKSAEKTGITQTAQSKFMAKATLLNGNHFSGNVQLLQNECQCFL